MPITPLGIEMWELNQPQLEKTAGEATSSNENQ